MAFRSSEGIIVVLSIVVGVVSAVVFELFDVGVVHSAVLGDLDSNC